MLPSPLSPTSPPGPLLAAIGIAVALSAALGLFLWEPWHGPVILSLSTGHGINAGDLLAVPLVAIAIRIYRNRPLRPSSVGRLIGRSLSGHWVGATSAVLLGVVLLAAVVVDLSDRGPMVPVGGGTFDGAVQFVPGRSPNPVGAWSYVALAYDGSTLRLFVNGHRVATRATTGSIERTGNPLWLGGNHPFGEFFDGLIDEARVYDRALSGDEIRADMGIPVATSGAVRGRANLVAGTHAARPHAVGLVAAYSFDEGSGSSVADGSGNGNVGRVAGATWTRGRYGNALNFDGADDIVRVPPARSLDVESELTLSAWIRPAASQSGWQTIIYRERDTFFLGAGSELRGFVGRVDDLLAGLVVVAAAWFALVMAVSRGRWLGGRRGPWPWGAAIFLLGCVADAVFAPSATVIGPTLLAVWFAVSAQDRGEAAVGWLVAMLLTAVTVGPAADLAGIGNRLQRYDGGLARSAALGVTLLAIGLVMLRHAPRSPAQGAASTDRAR